MIMDKSVYFEKGIQAFIEILNSVEFKTRVAGIGNYNFNKSGRILYN